LTATTDVGGGSVGGEKSGRSTEGWKKPLPPLVASRNTSQLDQKEKRGGEDMGRGAQLITKKVRGGTGFRISYIILVVEKSR